MKITIQTKPVEEQIHDKDYYQQLVIDRLNCGLRLFEYHNNTSIRWCANSATIFPRVVSIVSLICNKKLHIFHYPPDTTFNLIGGHKWKDVWDKIKNINFEDIQIVIDNQQQN